jgi:hypothetical protein
LLFLFVPVTLYPVEVNPAFYVLFNNECHSITS